MNDALPILDSCNDCGACCFEQQSPPGYVMLMSNPAGFDDEAAFADDLKRLCEMPKSVLAELRAYLGTLLACDEPDDNVCLWLAQPAAACSGYETRHDSTKTFANFVG